MSLKSLKLHSLSPIENIPIILKTVRLLNPFSILDIGIGTGKYGLLIRENLDYIDKLEGIEAFPDYISDVQQGIYDKIHIGNALEILPNLKKYDLILLIEILEHFKEQEAKALLEEARFHAKSLIVSVPIDNGISNPSEENIYDIHQYQWSKKDFSHINQKMLLSSNISYVYLIGDDWYVMHPFMKFIRKIKRGD